MKSHASAAAIVFAALALACGGREGPAEAPAHPVVTTGVQVSDVEERIAATGELQAKDQAAVAAEVPGQVTDVLVEEGQHVDAGQVVLEIDPEKRQLELDNAKAMLSQAKASLAEAERNHARWKSLHEQNIAADSRMDTVETVLASARSQRDAAEAAVGVAELALRDASVARAVRRLVARRFVRRGDHVPRASRCSIWSRSTRSRSSSTCAERDSARVAVAHAVEVRVDAVSRTRSFPRRCTSCRRGSTPPRARCA